MHHQIWEKMVFRGIIPVKYVLNELQVTQNYSWQVVQYLRLKHPKGKVISLTEGMIQFCGP